MIDTKAFGERMQELMDHYNLSASAFADSIDTGRSSISHILSGRNKPSLDFILKITSTYPDVDIHWILNGKGIFPKDNSIPVTDTRLRKTDTSPPGIQTTSPTSGKQDLFSQPEGADNSKKTSYQDPIKTEAIIPIKETSDKVIRQIIIFYDDGSFELFKN